MLWKIKIIPVIEEPLPIKSIPKSGNAIYFALKCEVNCHKSSIGWHFWCVNYVSCAEISREQCGSAFGLAGCRRCTFGLRLRLVSRHYFLLEIGTETLRRKLLASVPCFTVSDSRSTSPHTLVQHPRNLPRSSVGSVAAALRVWSS